MAAVRDGPYLGINFTVDLGMGGGEGPESGLMEVVFPEARIQMSEYRNGNDANEPVKSPCPDALRESDSEARRDRVTDLVQLVERRSERESRGRSRCSGAVAQ